MYYRSKNIKQCLNLFLINGFAHDVKLHFLKLDNTRLRLQVSKNRYSAFRLADDAFFC